MRTTAARSGASGSRASCPTGPVRRSYLETRVNGRITAEAVTLSDKSKIEAGTLLTEEIVTRLRDDPAVDRVRVRSVLTCEAEQGICAACYGQSLATGEMIELGEAVGVIAAQSIGEPGTQLTMRTFHTGGIVGEDITHGLPRVVELFEARTPKGAAVLARHSGVVRVEEDESGRHITVVADDGEEHTVLVAQRAHLEVVDGQEVGAGDALVEGPKDPKELLEVKGIRETQQYLVEEVQKVYRDQGVSIHDKHIELIVRQMLRRVLVAEPGDASFLPGERVDSRLYAEVNRQLVQDGQASGRGPARADGDHQGLAGHRELAVGRLVPGDHPGAHRGRHRGQVGPAVRPEGEHHHRQADPGRLGHGALPRTSSWRCPGAEAMPFWALGSEGDAGTEDLAAWLRDTGGDASLRRLQLGDRRQLAGHRARAPRTGRRVARPSGAGTRPVEAGA